MGSHGWSVFNFLFFDPNGTFLGGLPNRSNWSLVINIFENCHRGAGTILSPSSSCSIATYMPYVKTNSSSDHPQSMEAVGTGSAPRWRKPLAQLAGLTSDVWCVPWPVDAKTVQLAHENTDCVEIQWNAVKIVMMKMLINRQMWTSDLMTTSLARLTTSRVHFSLQSSDDTAISSVICLYDWEHQLEQLEQHVQKTNICYVLKQMFWSYVIL